MSIQTETKKGVKVLPAASALIALSNHTGRGARWDSTANALVASSVDESPEFIIDDVDTANNTVSAIPFTSDSDFRVRLHTTLTGALVVGGYVKIEDSGNGVFDLGGGSGDVNVARVEEAAAAGGYALVRKVATVTS